jgi:hypothetical protein
LFFSVTILSFATFHDFFCLDWSLTFIVYSFIIY